MLKSVVTSPIIRDARNHVDALVHGQPIEDNADADYCYVCERVTRWTPAQQCVGCRREWGYDAPTRAERIESRRRRRAHLKGAGQAAVVLGLVATVLVVGINVGLDALADRQDAANGGPLVIEPCLTEDSMGTCYWDADLRENGSGTSFIVIDDVVTYLPAGVR